MPGDFDYKFASLLVEPTNEPSGQALGVPEASPRYTSSAFRILRLLPGEKGDPISCNLLVRRLRHSESKKFEDAEPYEALSYHWGDQSSPKQISILANDTPYSKAVGRELYGALAEFRHRTDAVYLWVDALCINQNDPNEKSVQIPLMRRIYGSAELVRVWLGEAENESDLAMEFVETCLGNLEGFDKLVKEPGSSHKWAALSNLIRRRWFSRRWIIQEIALPKYAVVHCGTRSVEWPRFASVIKMVSRKEPELRELFRQSTEHKNHPDFLGDLSELGAMRLADIASHLFRKTTEGNITERKFSLDALMSSMTAFEASDPHDVLYAILWLAKDAHPVTKHAPRLRRPRGLSDANSDYDWQDPPTPTTYASSAPPSPNRLNPGSFEQPSEMTTPGVTAGASHLSPSLVAGRKRTLSGASKTSNASRPGSSHSRHSGQPSHVLGLGIGPVSQPDLVTVPEATISSVPELHIDVSQVGTSGTGVQRLAEVRANARAVDLLFTGMSRARIVVDYRKTILEVCKDFLGSSIRQSHSLDMICKPWAPSPADETLPLWIPRLSGGPFGPTEDGIHRRINADSLVKRLGHHGTGQKPYNAAKGHRAQWHFGGIDQKSLFAQGFVLDVVREKKEAAYNGAIPESWLDAGNWADTKKPPPEHFWRTLVGNLDSEGMFAPMYWSYSCHDAVRRRARNGPVDTSQILLKCPSLVKEFLERVQRVVWSKRLVLLEKLSQNPLLLALAPTATKKGDLICILAGCSVPVVLRETYLDGDVSITAPGGEPVATSRKAYEFIGECYVHDMMDGEAIEYRRKAMKKAGETEMFETLELR